MFAPASVPIDEQIRHYRSLGAALQPDNLLLVTLVR
jgi:hypothetical protein